MVSDFHCIGCHLDFEWQLTFCAWQIAFTGVVYPCLILAYMGEAAYLSKNKENLQASFYKAIPGKTF